MDISNEQVVRRFIERVWSRGDLAAADTYLGPQYTIHSDPGDPWEGQTLDREAFKFRLAASREPFPDLAFAIETLVANGSRVVASWVMRGTHQKAMGEVPASGRTIEVRGITIYELEDGAITGHHQVVDRLAVMQQLGLLGPGAG